MRGEGLGMAEPQLTRTDRSDGSYATCHAAIGGYIGGTPPIPPGSTYFKCQGKPSAKTTIPEGKSRKAVEFIHLTLNLDT